MAEDRKQQQGSQQNEGEGNRTAARQYNEGATQHARSGKVEKQARDAADAIEGPEGPSIERARQESAKRAKEEDPQLKKG